MEEYMKRFLGTMIFVMLFAGAIFAKKTTMAILNFETKNAPGVNSATITEWLQTELVSKRKFVVVEREKLRKVMKEQKMVLQGLTSESDAAKLGEFLGSQMILVGEISYFGGMYVINVKAIDTSSAVIDFADKVMCYEKAEIVQIVSILADRVAKKSAGRNVRPFKIKKKQPKSKKEIKRYHRKVNRYYPSGYFGALEFGFLVGTVFNFGESSLYGPKFSYLLPSKGMFQFKIGLNIIKGMLNQTTRISYYSLIPTLQFNIYDNKNFKLGFGAGYTWSIGNLNEANDFITSLLILDRYQFTLGQLGLFGEIGVHLGKKVMLKIDCKLDYKLHYYWRNENKLIEAKKPETISAITAITDRQGFTTLIVSFKLDIFI